MHRHFMRLVTRLGVLLPPFALALAGSPPAAAAQEASGQAQITLNVKAPEPGETFDCGIPVSISYPKALNLKKMNVVAKAYHGNSELASTGIETDGRPLIGDRDQQRVEYSPAPLQFDLTEEDCEKVTGLGVVFASCTFADGEQENCLNRLRFEPETAGQVAFFVGEPKPPAR